MSSKGKYTIPKSPALWPILWRTIIFLGIIAMIFAVLNILAEYVRDFRSEADTAYVGLTHPFDTGKSCATFSEYFNEIREALDPKSGRIKYFIYSLN